MKNLKKEELQDVELDVVNGGAEFTGSKFYFTVSSKEAVPMYARRDISSRVITMVESGSTIEVNTEDHDVELIYGYCQGQKCYGFIETRFLI